jgi:hypothetical protein
MISEYIRYEYGVIIIFLKSRYILASCFGIWKTHLILKFFYVFLGSTPTVNLGLERQSNLLDPLKTVEFLSAYFYNASWYATKLRYRKKLLWKYDLQSCWETSWCT